MNAKLINPRRCIQDAQRVKQMDLMALLSQTNGSGRAVDSSASNRDLELIRQHFWTRNSKLKT